MRASSCKPARGKAMAKGGFVPFAKKGAKMDPKAKGKGAKSMPPWMGKTKK
jgi:hypothetical protein